MINNSDVSDNLLDINIEYQILKKQLQELENKFEIEKNINLKSKEYIWILESKLNENKKSTSKLNDSLIENESLRSDLGACVDKYERLLGENEVLEKDFVVLRGENESLKSDLGACVDKYERLLGENEVLEKDFAIIKNENENLLKEISSLTKENNLYKNSKSWKITKPFRTIRNKLKN